jgi:hypothetical protein
MYATIRRYTPKGTVEQKDVDEFKHRIEDKFLPVTQEIRGFHSYYVVNVDNKEILSISVFEDKTGASESTRRAAEFVKDDPMKDRLGSPEILEGELLVSKEAPVGAHLMPLVVRTGASAGLPRPAQPQHLRRSDNRCSWEAPGKRLGAPRGEEPRCPPLPLGMRSRPGHAWRAP